MKFHKVVIENIISALGAILVERGYADKVIERFLKFHKKWGSRDRKLFAETVYEIVRYRRRYWYLAGFDDKDYLNLSVINEDKLWKMWLAFLAEKGIERPSWLTWINYDLRSSNLSIDQTGLTLKDEQCIAIKESYPDWMYNKISTQFKEETTDVLRSLNEMAKIYLRVNTLKTHPKELCELLNAEGVPTQFVSLTQKNTQSHESVFPVALELVERKNVFLTECFKKGLFEIQDVSSQLIAPLLNPEPGMRVVDACAGGGGKSLHLAALMKNKGKIISMDIHEWKLKELRQRSTRNGIDIIELKVIENLKTIKRYENSFDRVLLDVPCSGSGVLRRNPDAKWKLSVDEVERLKSVQYEILSQYQKMMKPTGKLVYATCSLFSDENEMQVQRFLKEFPQWILEEEIKIFPHQQGFDGFYGARLSKKT